MRAPEASAIAARAGTSRRFEPRYLITGDDVRRYADQIRALSLSGLELSPGRTEVRVEVVDPSLDRAAQAEEAGHSRACPSRGRRRCRRARRRGPMQAPTSRGCGRSPGDRARTSCRADRVTSRRTAGRRREATRAVPEGNVTSSRVPSTNSTSAGGASGGRDGRDRVGAISRRSMRHARALMKPIGRLTITRCTTPLPSRSTWVEKIAIRLRLVADAAMPTGARGARRWSRRRWRKRNSGAATEVA